MRWYYANSIEKFLAERTDSIIGRIFTSANITPELTERHAWQVEITLLQEQLRPFEGNIYFEFSIPRMGKRVDVIVAFDSCIAVLEFKVGEGQFKASALEQVWDYALDLKNFHETTHELPVFPILIATETTSQQFSFMQSIHGDGVYRPIKINGQQIYQALSAALHEINAKTNNVSEWADGKYHPTPTIIQAALALYRGHTVNEIARSDADATNLSHTIKALQEVIADAKATRRKAICFVTGVPGAGKTLVGLEIATENTDKTSELSGVYLSGNGPLVKILQEALARDRVDRDRNENIRTSLTVARRSVRTFVQNVHHFRDYYLSHPMEAPFDHVVIFDEAQRAWDFGMTARFVRERHDIQDFESSESEYLISCMDRHKDWAVIVCLVGGGQEIHRGEAGIREWFVSVAKSYPQWAVYCSPELVGKNYLSAEDFDVFSETLNIQKSNSLHLATSMRSFRAAELSAMVNAILDIDVDAATKYFRKIKSKYPLVITRDLFKAKAWLKEQARGSERYGIVVSSSAERLRPHAIHVKSPVDPVHWFLSDRSDVRSSYYLEDVATEFQIQGLELDWVCVTWDADLRLQGGRWSHHSFSGSSWKKVHRPERQQYLENAYRVLMTRARQGMVLVVPDGSDSDPTRNSNYYDPTYNFLKSLGFPEIH
jgi:hypothetical protein